MKKTTKAWWHRLDQQPKRTHISTFTSSLPYVQHPANMCVCVLTRHMCYRTLQHVTACYTVITTVYRIWRSCHLHNKITSPAAIVNREKNVHFSIILHCECCSVILQYLSLLLGNGFYARKKLWLQHR